MNKVKRLVNSVLVTAAVVVITTGCEFEKGESIGQDVRQIAGLTYTMDSFDNYGHKTMTLHGERIRIDPNIVTDRVYNSSDNSWSTIKTESSVVTVTIDGHEMESCGDTLIFYEDDLVPDYNFSINDYKSESNDNNDSASDIAILGYIANRYKNLFGKKRVALIKSQMGTPIYAFSGDSVYWEVSEKLPKCTKISIDGKALYIHRANFQIVDTSLLSEIDSYGMNTETDASYVEQQKKNVPTDEGLNETSEETGE